MFQIQKTNYQLGAFINDLDLTKPLTDEDKEHLYKALSEHEVLFFRDQNICLLYTSPSPRDNGRSRMPSSA